MKNDSHRVWLVLSSGSGETAGEIASKVGLGLQQRQKRIQNLNLESLRYAQVKRIKSNLVLASDLEIDEANPIEIHLSWVVDRCGEGGEALISFLGEAGNTGIVFIYINAEADVRYLELNKEFISILAKFGLGLEVKFEKD